MSDKKQGMMPQSTAGLIRYFDEGEGSFKIRPEYIIGICAALIVIEVGLKFHLF
jgi:preprotein translocase subunit Sec61beta